MAADAPAVATAPPITKRSAPREYVAQNQRERLLARLDDPDKHWKFKEGDLAERARWADYLAAFEDMLELASQGAKVLQVRSVELGMVHNMPIFVRSSFDKPEDIDPYGLTSKLLDRLELRPRDECNRRASRIPRNDLNWDTADRCGDPNAIRSIVIDFSIR